MVDGVFTVAHLSDVWLGYRDKASLRKMTSDSLDGKAVPVRELDVYVAWDSAISGVIADGVDAVVIAGDLFYESHPSYRALAHALGGLKRLSEAGIPVYVIVGNRDAGGLPMMSPIRWFSTNLMLGFMCIPSRIRRISFCKSLILFCTWSLTTCMMRAPR